MSAKGSVADLRPSAACARHASTLRARQNDLREAEGGHYSVHHNERAQGNTGMSAAVHTKTGHVCLVPCLHRPVVRFDIAATRCGLRQLGLFAVRPQRSSNLSHHRSTTWTDHVCLDLCE